jgi:hypothetical protein
MLNAKQGSRYQCGTPATLPSPQASERGDRQDSSRAARRFLLEAAPEGYPPDEIVTAITSQPGAASVHDGPGDGRKKPG